MRKDPERKKKLTENLFNLNTILDLDPEAEKEQEEQEEKEPLHENEEIEQHDTDEILPESYWYEDNYQRYPSDEEEEYQKQSPEKLEYEEDEKSAPENLVFAWDEGLVPDEYGSHIDEEEKEPYEEESLISPYNIHLNEQKLLDEEYLLKLKEALDLLKSLKPNQELITAINLIEDVVKGRK